MSVYPRWRGEHSASSVTSSITDGLSPLARGTLGTRFYMMRQHRFIPAGAGNTRTRFRPEIMCTVYPRWRGEHRGDDVIIHGHDGLSPLARGTHKAVTSPYACFRFIPAGAGNTGFFLPACHTVMVYPRWRGEHTKRISLFINYFLSAPHSTNIIATI